MKLIAKAALGALALASLATAAATPASAQRVEIGPRGVIVEPRNPCLRAPEFRPAYCFRTERPYWNRYAFNMDRDRMWRERERMRREEERRAELEQRGYYGYH
jgi:hypothetical protein